MYFAHSIGSRSQDNWQRLDEHLNEVANLASRFAAAFGTANAAGLAGLLHDLGKYSSAFQARLSGAPDSVDHSTAGAVKVMALVKGGRDLVAAELIAYAIAGHHAGLPDKFGGDSSLTERLKKCLEPLDSVARISAASRARSLCIRLKTFSEIWRDRSGAADSHIEGGDLEVAAFLVHLRRS